jgi:nucleotide-binding universal stress UspA family protein
VKVHRVAAAILLRGGKQIVMTQQQVSMPQQANDPQAPDQAHAFKRILVALDRSEASQVVLERAIAVAHPHHAELMLFSCIPDPLPAPSETSAGIIGSGLYGLDATVTVAMAEQRLEKSMHEVQVWLNQYREFAAQRGLNVAVDYKCGESGPCICKLAKTWNADLIVLGRRGRRGLTEALLGSVSNYVLHNAPCSVLTVQGVE